MNEETGDHDRIGKSARHQVFSRRWILALSGALVVILALVIGLNVGGLREKLLWRISPPRIDSVALLPFENLSGNPEQDYIARALNMRLITQLQRIGSFRVIAPASVRGYEKRPKPFPEIAKELNVSGIVQGGVLRSGDRIRISLKLNHASTDRRIWERTFERELVNIAKLEAEISRDIALEIKAKLTPRVEALLAKTRPVNAQAFDALLRGSSEMMAGGDPAKVEPYLKEAIQLDPAMPEPYVMLANRYYMRNMFPTLAPRDTYPAAIESAQKAISLDPDLPTISTFYRILALVALEYDWDFAAAETGFKRSVEAGPSGVNALHYYSHYLLSMGRMQEADAESKRAMELDPLSPGLIACISWHDIAERDYEQAEKRALQALSLGAPDQLARLTLGWSYALRGRHDEAIAEFQKAVVGWKGAVFPTAVLGHGYAVAGNKDAAQEVLNGLLERFSDKKEYVSPYEIAMVYAGLGDRDRAFEWLEKAYEDRSTLLVYFRMDPRIWGLRSDPRHQDLLRRMNFPGI